jgi:hypothetical protein
MRERGSDLPPPPPPMVITFDYSALPAPVTNSELLTGLDASIEATLRAQGKIE